MTDEKENKDNETFERVALYLAVLLGMEWKTYEELKSHPADFDKVISKMHEDPSLLKTIETVEKANNSISNNGISRSDKTKQDISKEDSTMEEITIQDNGESEVQVACIGTVIGSDHEGMPVEQNFTEEALKRIADTQKDDILVDADHDSELGDTTEAKGWLSNLFFKDGVGLFGKIKWTDIGRKLIENRVFRWLSPAWMLNDKMEPEYMTSCALTNKPAQEGRIKPIINSKPDEKKDDEMTKPEQVVEDNTVGETPTEETKEDKAVVEDTEGETDEQMEVVDGNTEILDQKSDEDIDSLKSMCEQKDAEIKTKSEELSNKEQELMAKSEEINALKIQLDDMKREIESLKTPKEVKSKPEVIKIDALNSRKTSSQIIDKADAWKNLHGKAFFDYIAKHKNELS